MLIVNKIVNAPYFRTNYFTSKNYTEATAEYLAEISKQD